MHHGFFLSLDGIDGTGKSTQCRLLGDWLRQLGLAVVPCIDPGGTPLGDEVRALVLNQKKAIAMTSEALLFMASRAQLVASVIRPALAAGSIVLSDRFLLANVVYQGYAGGLDPEQLWQVGNFATGGLEPDLTLVLDLPIETAQARRQRPADRVESRDQSYHERVRQGFLTEASRRPDRIRVLDASDTVAEVQRRIQQAVAEVLPIG